MSLPHDFKGYGRQHAQRNAPRVGLRLSFPGIRDPLHRDVYNQVPLESRLRLRSINAEEQRQAVARHVIRF